MTTYIVHIYVYMYRIDRRSAEIHLLPLIPIRKWLKRNQDGKVHRTNEREEEKKNTKQLTTAAPSHESIVHSIHMHRAEQRTSQTSQFTQSLISTNNNDSNEP